MLHPTLSLHYFVLTAFLETSAGKNINVRVIWQAEDQAEIDVMLITL